MLEKMKKKEEAKEGICKKKMVQNKLEENEESRHRFMVTTRSATLINKGIVKGRP